jgi:hypothetical protein
MDAADFCARPDGKKGVSKKRAKTSTPSDRIKAAANMLSRPPENTHKAFISRDFGKMEVGCLRKNSVGD